MAEQQEASLGKVHVPLGKDGEGLYTEKTKGCFDVIAAATPMVLDALSKVPAPSAGSAFTIADYGTADAGTSLPLMYTIVEKMRSSGNTGDIQINYEDQANNEWKSVFAHAYGHLQVPGVKSFYKDFQNVFVTGCGEGFHSQCYPAGSIMLGVSFTAMHWLSQNACNIKGALHSTQSEPAEKATFIAQAEKDFEKIMLARSKELCKGGQLVVVNFAESKEGYYLGWSGDGANMHANFAKLWRELVDKKVITEEEFEKCTFFNHYRTEEEQLKPFQPGNPVYESGLRLIKHETKVVPCPYKLKMKAGEFKGTPEEYAEWFYCTTRTWSNSTFFSGLSESRPEAERLKIVEDFWASYRALIAKDPAAHGMDYCHTYLHIEKV
ncbi:hypothetical protein CYMTET_7248 [Cymbomonas tetramitiformis]|uniref:Uncharacterized protein n=1 Tax=Cymbomonas tetramitiformis TaxID=36881 RepID=A0AAE0GVU6_9CHLO|nr:hypothetical protein CYMTET_7248 [Cymbomonas tetramitiformis]